MKLVTCEVAMKYVLEKLQLWYYLKCSNKIMHNNIYAYNFATIFLYTYVDCIQNTVHDIIYQDIFSIALLYIANNRIAIKMLKEF